MRPTDNSVDTSSQHMQVIMEYLRELPIHGLSYCISLSYSSLPTHAHRSRRLPGAMLGWAGQLYFSTSTHTVPTKALPSEQDDNRIWLHLFTTTYPLKSISPVTYYVQLLLTLQLYIFHHWNVIPPFSGNRLSINDS